MLHIYPSLMAANPLNLGFIIRELEPYCAGFHIDVMDNHFAPNLSFGPAIINKIATATIRPFWVHLMVENPESLLATLILPPSSLITIHIGTSSEIKKALRHIREKKYGAGIALSPKNKVSAIIPLMDLVDQVLIMSVEPGFSGQQFIPTAIDALDELVNIRKKMGASFRIGMDGGIDEKNIGMLAQKGVDDFAVGSAIFDVSDPVEALRVMGKADKTK